MTKKGTPFQSAAALEGACLAVNDMISQSGWAAPWTWAMHANIRLGTQKISGAHVASAEMVAQGLADVAAIDAVTWTFIERYEQFARNLQIVATTAPTPALPYITSLSQDAALIRHALAVAVSALATTDRETLCLSAITEIAEEEYLRVHTPTDEESLHSL